MEVARPRVAGIGLDDSQADSILPLCGTLRRAPSLDSYLRDYDWTETDILVSSSALQKEYVGRVHLLAVGYASFNLGRQDRALRHISTTVGNTEREVTVPHDCPPQFEPLATGLSNDLARADDPPPVFGGSLGQDDHSVGLIQTTSGRPVALRLRIAHRPEALESPQPETIALVLPKVRNLAAWFSAFLAEVNAVDPERVPKAPPRLMTPADWYTPEEATIAEGITAATLEIEQLLEQRAQLQTALDAAGSEADSGIRQAVWSDGEELVAAVARLLTELGFEIEDMDAPLAPNEPRREDLRLTHENHPGWESIVEVKGYSQGTKTSDSRQIREHRDRYTAEKGRVPDLTVWLANPFRSMDPSSRPRPDGNVRATAEQIGAVHVLAPDLYRQWTLVKAGRLDRDAAAHSLMSADPGLWVPFRSDPANDAATGP